MGFGGSGSWTGVFLRTCFLWDWELETGEVVRCRLGFLAHAKVADDRLLFLAPRGPFWVEIARLLIGEPVFIILVDARVEFTFRDGGFRF